MPQAVLARRVRLSEATRGDATRRAEWIPAPWSDSPPSATSAGITTGACARGENPHEAKGRAPVPDDTGVARCPPQFGPQRSETSQVLDQRGASTTRWQSGPAPLSTFPPRALLPPIPATFRIVKLGIAQFLQSSRLCFAGKSGSDSDGNPHHVRTQAGDPQRVGPDPSGGAARAGWSRGAASAREAGLLVFAARGTTGMRR